MLTLLYFKFFLELLAQLVCGSDKFSSCLSSWLLLMPKLKQPPTTGGVIHLLTSVLCRSPAHLTRLTAHKKLLKLLLLRVLLKHVTSLKEADTPGLQEAILAASNSLLNQLMPAILASAKLTQALADFYTTEREALAAAVAGRGFQAGLRTQFRDFFAPDLEFSVFGRPCAARYGYIEPNVRVLIVDFVLFPIKYWYEVFSRPFMLYGILFNNSV